MPRREDHEVRKGHVGHWIKKKSQNILYGKGKREAVPLQAWSGPEGSGKLRFPDYMTMTQDGGKVSPTHRPPLPQEMLLVLMSVRS